MAFFGCFCYIYMLYCFRVGVFVIEFILPYVAVSGSQGIHIPMPPSPDSVPDVIARGGGIKGQAR